MAAFGAIAACFAMLTFFKLLHLEAEISEQRDKLSQIRERLDRLAHRDDVILTEVKRASKLSPEAAEFYRKNFGKEPPV